MANAKQTAKDERETQEGMGEEKAKIKKQNKKNIPDRFLFILNLSEWFCMRIPPPHSSFLFFSLPSSLSSSPSGFLLPTAILLFFYFSFLCLAAGFSFFFPTPLVFCSHVPFFLPFPLL